MPVYFLSVRQADEEKHFKELLSLIYSNFPNFYIFVNQMVVLPLIRKGYKIYSYF